MFLIAAHTIEFHLSPLALWVIAVISATVLVSALLTHWISRHERK